ncbi:MAG: PAS domain-containing sensor histidine kinase, partial [Candidatus Pacebacteria bacterium]|nr:PAS domain-containing sensor histidine kinase [Candidatus Paceibacterota bacterium]
KYSPRADKVEIDLDFSRGFVKITVRDYGLGIKQADAKKVFRPFFRSKETTQQPGLGMGLFLTKQIVHHYQGKVTFDSQEGKGTAFQIQLPVGG